MDKLSKLELTSQITKQNEQLKRYESRFRDVVTAYKGLAREKEALEASLAAITSKTDGDTDNKDESVAALTQSVSTLVAEKARMEEAFQNDKKIAKEQSDKIISDLQEQYNSVTKQKQLEIDNFRAKLAFEIQEREREQIEYSLMLKELQMKLTSERRSKEKLEDKLSITPDSHVHPNLEKKMRDLNNELEATQRKLNRAEARTFETPQMLIQLQAEIAQMKQSHELAMRDEKIKSRRVEEGAKRMCASQEERIATLEARLAELSETIGEYDRQRRKDQEVIQQLKNNSSSFMKTKAESTSSLERDSKKSFGDNPDENSNIEPPTGMAYLQDLIDKIHNLKKDLIIGNEAMGNPIDIWNIFNISGSGVQNIHAACKAELAALKTEYELFKRQHSQDSDSSVQQKKINKNQVEKLKTHVKSLQEKAEILNQQLEDTEKECEAKVAVLENKIKTMTSSHKEELADYKNRIILLEQQLQTQRERYSILLGEREGEIKARHEKENEGKNDITRFMNGVIQVGDTPTTPMLHYAHEFARKDLEISQLRKEKHLLEGQLRDCQRDITIEKDRFKEVRRNLKEEIDRLLRIQSREGANLEYLKNVVLSYLLSTDLYRKKHMLKAIAAVLHFTDTEKDNAYKAVL